MAKRKTWTPEENEILRANYKGKAEDIAELLPERTEAAIKMQASLLGLANQRRPWTDEEVRILGENYQKLAAKEIHKRLLPNHSEASIRVKASTLGLSRTERAYRKNCWTEEELKVLKGCYPKYGSVVTYEALDGKHTFSAIRTAAGKLGLKVIGEPRPSKIKSISGQWRDVKNNESQ